LFYLATSGLITCTMSDLRAPDEDAVKGGKEIALLAAKGMALFEAKGEDEVTLDTAGAEAYKTEMDAKFAALEAEAAALTGKDNKKARTEKSKEAAAVKNDPKYIDAQKVIKGQPPKNGNFATVKAAAVAAVAEAAVEEVVEEKKDDKAKKPLKATASTGISKAERDELEKLKNDLIARKKELKESGMSGGQMNKDEQVMGWVKRMNELKEKENPGALAAQKDEKKGKNKKAMSADSEAAKKALEEEIETYKGKLKTEFGYSGKEIKADPDLVEMLAKLAAIK